MLFKVFCQHFWAYALNPILQMFEARVPFKSSRKISDFHLFPISPTVVATGQAGNSSFLNIFFLLIKNSINQMQFLNLFFIFSFFKNAVEQKTTKSYGKRNHGKTRSQKICWQHFFNRCDICHNFQIFWV